MIILGAGLAGLLAGNMLRRFNPVIYEAQYSLPNNHSALLRFRTDAAANALAIPFKKVKVFKGIKYKGRMISNAGIEVMNMYSEKVTGEYRQRSLEDLRPVERYIAPHNLIEQSAAQLNISYNTNINSKNISIFNGKDEQIISTIPMDKMMEIIDWECQPEFKYLPIWTYSCIINTPTDLYQTIYYPGDEAYYRCSITGDKLIIECDEDPGVFMDAEFVLKDFGISSSISNGVMKHQKYGKLLPIDDQIRKRFILHLTEQYGIYSLGRFATWRQILLDDVVNDVNVIEGLMQASGYDRKKSAA